MITHLFFCSPQAITTNSSVNWYKWDPCKSNILVVAVVVLSYTWYQQISSIQFDCCLCLQLFLLPSLWYVTLSIIPPVLTQSLPVASSSSIFYSKQSF